MKKKKINKYIEFIKLINNYNEKKIEIINNDEIKLNLKCYLQNISCNKKFKKYLLERRVKLFYSNNLKFIENCNIKNILEKVDEDTRTQIWTYLQLFYILENNGNDNYTLKLINSIENNINKMKKEIGYVENNTLPSNIYDKIYKEFR